MAKYCPDRVVDLRANRPCTDASGPGIPAAGADGAAVGSPGYQQPSTDRYDAIQVLQQRVKEHPKSLAD